ncbi:fibronectin-binding domain-containing protein [Sulfolobus sp. S-194]|uniref:ribosome rescue protein RqcH n=1 Tax=Sulfolobus sp. S-194 TaxID=2512240 RepID=UPI00143730D8|nr:ribosome rescue protein RqcH [Sulfolobus sp. S-194]QIW25288.1 fibronectin-binding domain-containing protein [Sulfolobus sp. S-194]
MSYLDLLAWITENKNEIISCRVDNVYKISGTQAYFLKLHCKNGDKNLVIEPGKRIHFTKYDRQKEISSEVSLIRAHIKDKIINNIELLGKERILKLTFMDRLMYIELLPRGLLVITDLENRILFATEYKEFKDRVIKPNVIYAPPPPPPPLTDEEIDKLLKKGNLSRILGVPQEIIEALEISVLNKQELDNAILKIKKLEEDIEKGNFNKCLIPNLTVLPLKFDSCIEKDNYNDALDEFFTNEEKTIIKSETDKKLEEEKKKLVKTIEEIENEIETYKKEEYKYRNIANILIANYQNIENEINKNLGKNIIKIKLNEYEIELDPKLSVYKNASKYFDIAKEYAEKIKKAEETLNNLKQKLKELDKQIEERTEEIRISLRKREWYEKYRWSFTRNGYLVIAGRDIDQNESLVRKLLEPKDIFLHADIQGAPATIIKTQGNNVTEDDIRDAAVIAACYSKAWKVGMGAIDVFWVNGDQVSKSPPSGEYLKKGSFMIYGKKNFINNVKMQLFLGLTEDFKVIVGSEEVVKKYSGFNIFILLEPGDEDPSKLSAKIIKILQEKLKLKGLRTLQDDIIRSLPGKSKIVAIKNKT